MPRKKARQRTPTPSPEPEQDPSAAGSDDEEAESSEEEVYVEPLLATRGRRANAGNRMQALIEDEAAAEVEEMFQEEEGDVDFANKEEKDEFDSDFGSTDEGEGDEDDEEAGEKRLQREAKEDKKAAKSKKKGFQAPIHPFARQSKGQRLKAQKDKGSQGGAVASTSASTLDDEEGGEARPAKRRKKAQVDPEFLVPQRESSRRTAVESRKRVEAIKSTGAEKPAPKPAKKKSTPSLTQADLIAEALETEEINRAALLAFYAAEEERRESERIAGMRYEIIGAKITFLSRTEGKRMELKGKGKEKMDAGRRRMIEVVGESGKVGWQAPEKAPADPMAMYAANPVASTYTSSAATAAAAPKSLRNLLNTPDATPPPAGSSASAALAAIDVEELPNTPPEREEYTRNWLVFGNTDEEPITRQQELEAVFGEHEEEWESERVQKPRAMKDGEGKPLPSALCPITGLPALYLDPLTLTPYATPGAFKILRSRLTEQQTYVYSDALGGYTGTSGLGVVREVEGSWGRRGARGAPMLGGGAVTRGTPVSGGAAMRSSMSGGGGGGGGGGGKRASLPGGGGAFGSPSPFQQQQYAYQQQQQQQGFYPPTSQPFHSQSPFANPHAAAVSPFGGVPSHSQSQLQNRTIHSASPFLPPHQPQPQPSPFAQPQLLNQPLHSPSLPSLPSLLNPSNSAPHSRSASPFFSAAPGQPGFVLPSLPGLPGLPPLPGV